MPRATFRDTAFTGEFSGASSRATMRPVNFSPYRARPSCDVHRVHDPAAIGLTPGQAPPVSTSNSGSDIKAVTPVQSGNLGTELFDFSTESRYYYLDDARVYLHMTLTVFSWRVRFWGRWAVFNEVWADP